MSTILPNNSAVRITRFFKEKTAKLFIEIDNSQLIAFRIIYGILLCWHCLDCIFSGWIGNNFIKPKFTFSHIGFEWLQPLPGNGLYYYFFVMAVLGVFIALGFLYRYSIILFTVLWTGTFLMQKTSYNNHYYLMVLISLIMCFQPAGKRYSLDAKINPKIKSNTIPAWWVYIMVLQIAIVYFYATVAKFYPDWLDGTFTKILLKKTAPSIFRELYTQPWFYLSIAYLGIIYDLLIVILLCYKKTRNYALGASIFFHLFNKIHLGIGIFPFLALSFTLFFYPPETISKVFFRKKIDENVLQNDKINQAGKKILLYFFLPYFILQVLLPLRHWAIKGDVLWTEEGHRLSWRMMLRNKEGAIKFYVYNKQTKEKTIYPIDKLLTKKQIDVMKTRPDMIWQTAQKIKEEYATKRQDISIYIDCKVSTNKHPHQILIDPAVDFTTAEWDYFGHNDWVLLH